MLWLLGSVSRDRVRRDRVPLLQEVHQLVPVRASSIVSRRRGWPGRCCRPSSAWYTSMIGYWLACCAGHEVNLDASAEARRGCRRRQAAPAVGRRHGSGCSSRSRPCSRTSVGPRAPPDRPRSKRNEVVPAVWPGVSNGLIRTFPKSIHSSYSKNVERSRISVSAAGRSPGIDQVLPTASPWMPRTSSRGDRSRHARRRRSRSSSPARPWSRSGRHGRAASGCRSISRGSKPTASMFFQY